MYYSRHGIGLPRQRTIVDTKLIQSPLQDNCLGRYCGEGMSEPQPMDRIHLSIAHTVAALCPQPSWWQLFPGKQPSLTDGVHPSLSNNQALMCNKHYQG